MWNYAQHFAMSDNARPLLRAVDTRSDQCRGPARPTAWTIVATTKSRQRRRRLLLRQRRPGRPDHDQRRRSGYDVARDPKIRSICPASISAICLTAPASPGAALWAASTWTPPTRMVRPAASARRIRLIVGDDVVDYIPHHAWFQYYASTANPTHARPNSIARSATARSRRHAHDPANHQYDLDDFYAAVSAGNFPAVSFLKLPAYQDGHAAYSDPLTSRTAW